MAMLTDSTAATPRHAGIDPFFSDSKYFSDSDFCATS